MAADALEFEGTCIDVGRSDMHHVRVKAGDREWVVCARRCGRMNHNHIRVLPGDRVMVEVTPYDLTKGRITQRIRA